MDARPLDIDGGSPGRSHEAVLIRALGFAAAVATAAAAVTPAQAQDVTFGAQVRPRFEYRDPTPLDSRSFTSMRVRASIEAALPEGVGLFVQFQDVRLWGSESSTLGDFDADNLDLHQGYLQLKAGEDDWFTGRAGRQRTRFGGERLVGWVGWTQQGRSFDGVRLVSEKDWGRVDLVGYQVEESAAAGHDEDGTFLGVHSTFKRVVGGTLDVYGLLNHVVGEEADTEQGTLGLRHVAAGDRFRYRAEASYQFGTRAGRDVAAFMVGARVAASLGDKAWLTLWYDYLSGGAPDDEKAKVFDTLFATNHKFYGFADLFLNIPRQTDGRGLQDLALKAQYTPAPKFPLGLALHSFYVAESTGLDSGHLGEELDLTATYRYSPNLAVVGGFSYVFQAQGLADIGRLEKDMTWTYLMINVSF